MSRLNPHAGEFVPSFPTAPEPAATAAVATGAATAGVTSSTPGANAKATALGSATSTTGTGSSGKRSGKQSASATADAKPAAKAKSTATAAVTKAAATEPASAQDTVLAGNATAEAASPDGRLTYSIPYLLAFQHICDSTPQYFPDVVRAPPPLRLGRVINDRLVYTVSELLQFQGLYEMPPPDLNWTETLVSTAPEDARAKPAAKSKKDKAKQQQQQQQQQQMRYDPSLLAYFNPTEYAAALNMAMYGTTGGGAADNGTGSGGTGAGDAKNKNGSDAAVKSMAGGYEAVNTVEEALFAKRRLVPLLDDVSADSLPTILREFEQITIQCTHTLQEIINIIFDRAIAEPDHYESYAALCAGLAERTPEFKEGAKTINFRRILLTKCYEALIEEPEPLPATTPVSTSTQHSTKSASPTHTVPQHAWRRQCMLGNVGLIGELFRRQLLTENIMHVSVAMMLEEEDHPQMTIVDAACRLLALVGDLLDGSSPASRRTMDEYFDVLHRLGEREDAPTETRMLIAEMTTSRANGWVKKRVEPPVAASATAVAAPAPASAVVSTTAATATAGASVVVPPIELVTSPVSTVCTGSTAPAEAVETPAIAPIATTPSLEPAITTDATVSESESTDITTDDDSVAPDVMPTV